MLKGQVVEKGRVSMAKAIRMTGEIMRHGFRDEAGESHEPHEGEAAAF